VAISFFELFVDEILPKALPAVATSLRSSE